MSPELWILLALLALGLARPAAGRRLTLAQLRALAADTGFPDPGLAAAVAMAESGGRAGIVVAEPHGGPSYGLWQIHQSAHPQYLPQALLDPAYNARAAFEISKGGTDWNHWSTFNDGSHRQYLPGDE